MQQLSFNEAGDGYPVVLLHGFCESKKLWDVFMAILSVKFRVIAIDLPGFGESPKIPQEKVSLEEFSLKVLGTLQTLKIKECIMIGHSLGGYVALSFAENYPNMLQGLGLFHSTSFEDSAEKKANRDKAVAFVEKYGTEKFVSNLFPNLFSLHNTKKLSKQIAYFVKDAAQTPIDVVVSTTKAMKTRPDRQSVLKQSDCPVLFIIGKDDASIPLMQSLTESSLPAESLVFILENVGHMGMIEASDKCITVVEQFIDYCLKKLEKK
ncbi:MAG: alpha/beta fold hydrolase [Bacteroidota bacterium]